MAHVPVDVSDGILCGCVCMPANPDVHNPCLSAHWLQLQLGRYTFLKIIGFQFQACPQSGSIAITR